MIWFTALKLFRCVLGIVNVIHIRWNGFSVLSASSIFVCVSIWDRDDQALQSQHWHRHRHRLKNELNDFRDRKKRIDEKKKFRKISLYWKCADSHLTRKVLVISNCRIGHDQRICFHVRQFDSWHINNSFFLLMLNQGYHARFSCYTFLHSVRVFFSFSLIHEINPYVSIVQNTRSQKSNSMHTKLKVPIWNHAWTIDRNKASCTTWIRIGLAYFRVRASSIM